jgi:hypothetical protein
MKKFTLIILFISACTMGQYFDQEYAEEPETNQNQFFDEHQSTQSPEPEYETYDPTNPGGAPIDDWAFLLPLAGIAVGVYFIRKKWELGTRN